MKRIITIGGCVCLAAFALAAVYLIVTSWPLSSRDAALGPWYEINKYILTNDADSISRFYYRSDGQNFLNKEVFLKIKFLSARTTHVNILKSSAYSEHQIQYYDGGKFHLNDSCELQIVWALTKNGWKMTMFKSTLPGLKGTRNWSGPW